MKQIDIVFILQRNC